MNFLRKYITAVLVMLGVMFVTVAAALIVAGTIYVLAPGPFMYLLESVDNQLFRLQHPGAIPGPTYRSSEELVASNDQVNISDWVLKCVRVDNLESLPANLENLLSSNPNVTYINNYALEFPPNNTTFRIARLSHQILSARYAASREAAASYVGLQVSIFVTIGLGLITTILVAISSSELLERGTRWGRAVRISALAFPAIGTAAAAVIAFYNPSASFARSTHAVFALRQLQGQITTGLWKMENPDCTMGDDNQNWKDVANKVDSWEQRYDEIIVASTSEGSTTSDQPKNQTAEKGGQSPQKNLQTDTTSVQDTSKVPSGRNVRKGSHN